MSMNVSSAGSQPMVVSGATRSVPAPSGGAAGWSGSAATPAVDFSSVLQSLLKTLGHAESGQAGSSINTYA